MLRLIVCYFSSLGVFLGIDGLVIFSFRSKLYEDDLRDVMADDFNVSPPILLYLALSLGLCYFAVVPAFEDGRWQTAALRGAVYGFFTSSVFTMTCFATTRSWTLQFALSDMSGGTVVASAVAISVFLISNRF